jgi:uncharacterized membrane protein YqhA
MQIIVYYSLLIILTLLDSFSAVSSIKAIRKKRENVSVYELTDRISWILGGIIIAILAIFFLKHFTKLAYCNTNSYFRANYRSFYIYGIN